MPISDCEVRDPRIRRTRQLLQRALQSLLRNKSLDEILVQDITDEATVNRATFYDHYTDKFALFEAMVAHDFHVLLNERNIRFDGSCSSGLGAIILAVCDYLQRTHSGSNGCVRHSAFTPLMEAAVTSAIRRVILAGASKHAAVLTLPPEIIANTVSWAVYGAAKEWFHTPDHRPAEEIVPSLVRLIIPLLEGSQN
ncbi:MAG TPA: TetR/AcrR family transcriptional regulator [Bryobacteraceae bacterium]|jgi:AcrR family transcriptional regulator